VAEKVIDYVVSLAKRSGKNLPVLVRNYFEKFDEFLPRHISFHLWSRLWLYKNDENARSQLDGLKDWYLGKGEDGIEKRIKELTTTTAEKDDPLTDRKRYYQKYPKLLKYSSLLFWWLMAREIYNEDVSGEIEKVAPKEEINSLLEMVSKDHEAIRILSSGATNFFYLTEAYLGIKVKTDELFNLVKSDKYSMDREGLKQRFYFLSHLVIGETLFYTRKEIKNRETCLGIVKELEKMIKNHYFKISLDMKFEFLVCCQILGHQTDLVEVINGEAERSLASVGNFLVDTHNAWIHGFGNKFTRSEHRNVLYLMSCGKKG